MYHTYGSVQTICQILTLLAQLKVFAFGVTLMEFLCVHFNASLVVVGHSNCCCPMNPIVF